MPEMTETGMEEMQQCVELHSNGSGPLPSKQKLVTLDVHQTLSWTQSKKVMQWFFSRFLKIIFNAYKDTWGLLLTPELVKEDVKKHTKEIQICIVNAENRNQVLLEGINYIKPVKQKLILQIYTLILTKYVNEDVT